MTKQTMKDYICPPGAKAPKAETLYPRESLGALRPQLLGSAVGRLPAMPRAASWLSSWFLPRSSWALRQDLVLVTEAEGEGGSTW